MTVFLIAAAVMAAFALALVLPPLLRTSVAGPAGGESAGKASRATAWSVAVAVPLVAAGLYAALGNPRGLEPAAEQAGLAAPPRIEAMVARLAARLKEQPQDAAGWRMLARSYETLRRFEAAADAYRRVVALEGESADLLVDYAVVLGMTQNQRLSGGPEKLVERALALEANHVQALALLGSAALERGDYEAARRPWRKILALVPADSDIGRQIADSVARVDAQEAESR